MSKVKKKLRSACALATFVERLHCTPPVTTGRSAVRACRVSVFLDLRYFCLTYKHKRFTIRVK